MGKGKNGSMHPTDAANQFRALYADKKGHKAKRDKQGKDPRYKDRIIMSDCIRASHMLDTEFQNQIPINLKFDVLFFLRAYIVHVQLDAQRGRQYITSMTHFIQSKSLPRQA